jgi:phospholipid/cholesterol/gamma-HCH transport system substrate-binding protein
MGVGENSRTFPGRRRTAAVALLVLALTSLAVVGTDLQDSGRRVTARFLNTVNLYDGARVKVLGVDVGDVTSVEVEGRGVTVEMSVDEDVRLPADVQAVIVPPSIVGDRYVQLTPAYAGGPELPTGAVIGLERTAVPVELDETYRQLTRLARALGPRGANRDGSLSQMVEAAAAAMGGNGRRFQRSLEAFADAMDTLEASDEEYQGTVDNLATFTHTLLENDDTVRRLVRSLSRVSTQLNAQRDDIATASRQLATALRDIDRFTDRHGARLTRGVAQLRDVSRVLHRRVQDIDDVLALAPVGFTGALNINVPTNWDPANPGASTPEGRTTSYAQRGVYTANLGVQLSTTITTVCRDATGPAARRLAPLCTALAAAGNDLGLVLAELANQESGDAGTVSGEAFLARLRRAAAESRGSR